MFVCVPPASGNSAVHSTLGSSFDYSTNRHEITAYYIIPLNLPLDVPFKTAADNLLSEKHKA